MGNSKSTIELNGKRYDARTGTIIGDTPENNPNPKVLAQPKVQKQQAGQILDGFVRRPSSQMAHSHQNATPSTKPSYSKTVAKPANRKLEKSKTLMRPAVKKPTVIKNDIQAVKQPPKVALSNSLRFARAQSTEKSPHINRFSRPNSTITKKEAHLPVITPSFAVMSKNVSNEIHKLENVLQDTNTQLHNLEEHTIKKVPFLNRVGFKNKFANLATLTVAMLVLVGFFAYQNSAIISMKYAASRSGVNAQLPTYKPSGYGLNGGVRYEPGKVMVTFKSRTDSKGYTITQQSSNWNSASLLANYVTKTRCTTCFQTWQNEGKTVYIYDNSNATWVNGGVWYQVEGDADLTSDQLLRLANSL